MKFEDSTHEIMKTETSLLNESRIERLLVRPDATIFQSMKVIDEGAVQLALVVDDRKKLLGVITDGDLRRALLSGADLDAAVLPFANTAYRFVNAKTSRNEALDLMKCFTIKQLPVLDDQGFVCGLHLLNELIQVETLPNAAVILAGGKGTRLGALTKTTPKPMISVAGRPILERIIIHLVGSGIRTIYLSVNYLSNRIEQHFGNGDKLGCSITYLKEDQPLGTGGPLALLNSHPVDNATLVMNGDLVVDFDVQAMLSQHHRDANAITIGVKNYTHQVPFGCLQTSDGVVTKLVEKPILQRTINAGIYAMSPEIIATVRPEFTPITSVIENALVEKRQVGTFQIDDWIDVGQPQQLAEARGE
ncbi:D-glycero-alpha-D-manno-heptose 1-phosphate guanylyltransferase [Stieleria neptunia]|uniref:D-glycero-alpha-D-manno-heptose 1-phosphate guanylyltransferase n=1 Tax=Stieleria neptunia TaxID=2527979 RepID=A0A518HTM0_9BACT|nr:D-glycero-alpha-D-manno-heptose 1-phosphate guanylyltransferase [Stieleria neptunia]